MKTKQKVTIVSLLMAFLVALSGCGANSSDSQSAKELIDKMIAVADGAVVTQSDCSAELDIQFGDEYNGVEYKTVYETHNIYDKESYRASSDIHFVANDDYSAEVKYNMVEEQGIFYNYSYSDEYGWIKYETCFPKEEMSRNFVSTMNLENAEILGYKEKAEQIDGKDVTKLSVALKDANVREFLFDSGIKYIFVGREYASIDLSDSSVKMDFYVEPETAQVLKVEARFEGLNQFINDFYQFKFTDTIEETWGAVELKNCKLVYDNISYEEIKVPMMSFEDKQKSIMVHQQDTVYTMKMLDSEVEVICPKWWIISEKTSDVVRTKSIGGDVYRNYLLVYGETPESFFEIDMPKEIKNIKDEGGYISDQIGPKMGQYDTYEVCVDGGVISYACAPIDNSVLVVCVVDYTSSRLDKSLPEVLDTVNCK